MSQITIRGLDPLVEQKIRRIAEKSGKSLNRVILDVVHGSIGSNKGPKKPAAQSLKKLAGGWSAKDAEEFNKSIEIFEQIDREMWM